MQDYNLALGDWVGYYKFIAKVEAIHTDYVSVLLENGYTRKIQAESLRPLPLTTDILQDCGYTAEGDTWQLPKGITYNFRNKEAYKKEKCIGVIRWVHNLQHLLHHNGIKDKTNLIHPISVNCDNCTLGGRCLLQLNNAIDCCAEFYYKAHRIKQQQL